MNNSRSNQCVFQIRSADDKNLNAKASSKKPSTTFTVFNHPPDFGSEFNQPGKTAKSVNGIAKANENPNIPMIGPIQLPCVPASTNNEPIIGPVHENDTNDNVNAMKKIPTNPPLFEASSALFTHELGRVISNAPKKDIAKITKSTKNPKFTQGFVAKAFKASAPKATETNIPKRTYMVIIETP